MNNRRYTVKDVELIISASVILKNAILKKDFLKTKRTNWTDDFFQQLEAKINSTTQTYLGLDSAKELRQATRVVNSIQESALTNLSQLKLQISEDFRKVPVRRAELLALLGFTTYFIAANSYRDQEALINLLFEYKTNITPEIKAEIIEKGTLEATLITIEACADTLKESDTVQEFHKGSKKLVTQEAVDAFNEIYDEVISFCKLARKFYKGDQVHQDLFSFSKITKAINGN